MNEKISHAPSSRLSGATIRRYRVASWNLLAQQPL